MPRNIEDRVANPAVAKVFEACPSRVRRRLLALRTLILETAASTPGVGELEEALKWGEPAYLTSRSKIGSTVRIGWKRSEPGKVAVYFNCRTHLVETFRTLFPSEFVFGGKRAIVFDETATVPKDALMFCIAAALTYHRGKAARAPSPLEPDPSLHRTRRQAAAPP